MHGLVATNHGHHLDLATHCKKWSVMETPGCQNLVCCANISVLWLHQVPL